MTFPQACQYLDSFVNYELQLDSLTAEDLPLRRFQELLFSIGSPQENLKAIHVAGTKGKGSTCEFTAQILRSLGYRVGLYTSPHLCDVRERIRVLEPNATVAATSDLFPDCISEQEFAAAMEDIHPRLEQARGSEKGAPTYFEVLTALAFVHFCRCNVDYVVLETGLGGRLDATNAVDALVYGITPISLEHTHILGKTVVAIAAEKAAIIKRDHPAVSSAQDPQALSVILKRCRDVQAPAVLVGKDILFQAQSSLAGFQNFSVQTAQARYELQSSLLGRHQIENAAMAIALVESLPEIKDKLDTQKISAGIAATRLPGRFEIIRSQPTIIFDGAHTPGSVAAVGKTLRENFPHQNVIAVLGLARDKDKHAIIEQVQGFAQQIILTRADHPRADDFAQWEKTLRISCPTVLTSSVEEALSLALTKARPEDVIFVVGSFYLVAEARQQLIVNR